MTNLTRYTFLIVLFVCFSIISCSKKHDNSSINDQIISSIDNRDSVLQESFRYNLKVYTGELISLATIDSLFTTLRLENDVSKINYQLEKIRTELGLTEKLEVEGDTETSLLLNKLRLMDQMVFMSQTENTFNSLRSVAFIKNETDTEVEYNFGLFAYDELFNPEVVLITDTDTIPIDVNDNGFGYLTVKKKYASDKHNFRGEIIVYQSNGNEKRLPFTFR